MRGSSGPESVSPYKSSSIGPALGQALRRSSRAAGAGSLTSACVGGDGPSEPRESSFESSRVVSPPSAKSSRTGWVPEGGCLCGQARVWDAGEAASSPPVSVHFLIRRRPPVGSSRGQPRTHDPLVRGCLAGSPLRGPGVGPGPSQKLPGRRGGVLDLRVRCWRRALRASRESVALLPGRFPTLREIQSSWIRSRRGAASAGRLRLGRGGSG